MHTATSPAAGVFQFGANNASEKPKVGGFNFSLNATPTFNFSEQNTQQVKKSVQTHKSMGQFDSTVCFFDFIEK